jgi:MFS family permease
VIVSVKQQNRFPQFILHAGVGLLADAVGSLVIGVIFPIAFPSIVRLDHYYGVGPSVPWLMVLAFLVSVPFSLVGGIVGGRVIREGGRREQLMAAAILGFLAALPFGFCSFWVFNGW